MVAPCARFATLNTNGFAIYGQVLNIANDAFAVGDVQVVELVPAGMIGIKHTK